MFIILWIFNKMIYEYLQCTREEEMRLWMPLHVLTWWLYKLENCGHFFSEHEFMIVSSHAWWHHSGESRVQSSTDSRDDSRVILISICHTSSSRAISQQADQDIIIINTRCIPQLTLIHSACARHLHLSIIFKKNFNMLKWILGQS